MPVQPESAMRGEGTQTEDRDAENAVAGGRVRVGGEKGNGVDTGRPAESKWTRKTGEEIGVVNASKGDGSGGKRDDLGQGRETTGDMLGKVMVMRVFVRRILGGGGEVKGSESDTLSESE
jgi:hypothetical protein